MTGLWLNRNFARPPMGPSLLLIRCGPLAESLRQAVRTHGFLAHVASPGSGLLLTLDRISPDTVVVGQPANESLELLEELAPHVRESGAVLLALLPSSEPEAAVQVLAAGADEVVAPPHSAASLLLRRRLVRARHGTSAELQPVDAGPIQLDRTTREVQAPTGTFNLTGREFDLLAYLRAAEGTAVRRRELMEEIWGRSQGSESVLDATVHRLRKSLESHGLTGDLIETVWGVGYRFDSSCVERLRPSPDHDLPGRAS